MTLKIEDMREKEARLLNDKDIAEETFANLKTKLTNDRKYPDINFIYEVLTDPDVTSEKLNEVARYLESFI
jgi:hypothetical protein